MSGIYDWIRDIIGYMVLMTAILNFLPDRKYVKYFRLFSGTLLILLVFRPAIEFTGLEEQTAGLFERITFQNDAKLLQREITDTDGKRLGALTESYKEAIETELKIIAEGTGLECTAARVTLNTAPENEGFGGISEVGLSIRAKEGHGKEIRDLKKRIGEYYGVEERKITVTLEDK